MGSFPAYIALNNHKKRIPKIKKQIGEEALNQLLNPEEQRKLAHVMQVFASRLAVAA